MTVNVRAQMFFSTDDNEGWSEGFYMTVANIAAAQTALDTLIAQRTGWLSADASIIYARVSDVAVKGDSLLTTATLPAVGGYAPSGSSPLEANTALMIELFASSTLKNRMFCRGLRSDTIVGRSYTPPSGFLTDLNTWITAMLAVPVSVRHRTAVGPPPTYSYTAVTSMSAVKATARKPGRPFGLPVGRR